MHPAEKDELSHVTDARPEHPPKCRVTSTICSAARKKEEDFVNWAETKKTGEARCLEEGQGPRRLRKKNMEGRTQGVG